MMKDYRFRIQQISHERWRQAVSVNLAADFLHGYRSWTLAFTDARPEWRDWSRFLLESSAKEIEDRVRQHRHQSLAFLVLMLTGACNADCPICFTDRRRKPRETNIEQRERVLKEAAGLGAQFVYVPGEGEPTIDTGWWPFLEACRQNGLHAVVFTNGRIFENPEMCQRYWDCSPHEAIARLRDYPVSLYVKFWTTNPELYRQMLGLDGVRLAFQEEDGLTIPTGLAQLMSQLPRDRVGVEIVVERRNADEVVERIAPFVERQGLARMIELLQHNGRTLVTSQFDPTPQQLEAVAPLLSHTSCEMAICKAVVTAQGNLSPRIAILEHQLPSSARHIDDGSLWDLLHTSDYLVHRRYDLGCLCEREPALQTAAGNFSYGSTGPISIPAHDHVPPNGQSPPAGQITAVDPHFANSRVTHSVHQLQSAAQDQEVTIVGRVVPADPNGWRLSDGTDSITLVVDAPSPFAWACVTGVWNPIRAELRVTTLTSLAPGDPTVDPELVPEVRCVRDERNLRPVVDRARLLQTIRGFFQHRDFLEVTTPMLQAAAEMCCVRQVRTEPVSGRPFYLRTDPEEHLKRYLTAGLPAVYEISTNVRDDGEDAWHLTEFQSVEFYRRMMPFSEAIALSDVLIRKCIEAVSGLPRLQWQGRQWDVSVSFPRVPFHDLLRTATDLDIETERCRTTDGLVDAIRELGLEVALRQGQAWRRAWLEGLFEEYVIPKLASPLWVTHFPADMALSSRLDPTSPQRSLRAELYLPGGLELAHVYENLTHPELLRSRYELRRAHRVACGLSYVPTNEGLMRSAQAGMPPMSGGAIGIDRLLQIARGDESIGAGLLFAGKRTRISDEVGNCQSCGNYGTCSQGRAVARQTVDRGSHLTPGTG